MPYTVSTPPISEPLSLADMKEHLRVLHDDDDDYINLLITAARKWIEKQYDLAIVSQTIQETFDEFDDDMLTLTIGPALAINSVKYYDTDNVEQTMNSSDYNADLVSFRARIKIATGTTVPNVYDRPGAIEVEYSAGSITVEGDIVHALKLIVGEWYKDRERMPGNVKTRMLDTVQKLLHVYK